jgi:PEP-CTERM motif
MKRSLLAIAFAVGLLVLGGTPAWAGSSTASDVGWTYSFTPGQNFVSADSPGSGTVSFTSEPTKTATNSSDVVVTNLRVSSTASPDTPDTLNSNGAWSVSLKLTDTGTGLTDTMNFSGKLGGTFSAANSNITNTFNSPTSYTWTAGTNGNVYMVSLVGYTPPGPPTASNAGSISAFVQVTAGNGNGHSSGTPEPSTLVLSCLGLGFAGLASWRKRRRSLAAVLA